MLKTEKWGLIVIDPDRTVFGELTIPGERVELLGSEINRSKENVWGHAPDARSHNYFAELAKTSAHMFLDDRGKLRPGIRAIFLGGNGDWKEFVYKEGYFPHDVQQVIVTKFIDTPDMGALTLEALARAAQPTIDGLHERDRALEQQRQIAAMRERQQQRNG